uniref:Uncharacterized protein n=1 Tax=Planktothricoides sp. SpSt-374 TaxID=2282167 RepID=A0A7C3ZJY2_9CYAN
MGRVGRVGRVGSNLPPLPPPPSLPPLTPLSPFLVERGWGIEGNSLDCLMFLNHLGSLYMVFCCLED